MAERVVPPAVDNLANPDGLDTFALEQEGKELARRIGADIPIGPKPFDPAAWRPGDELPTEGSSGRRFGAPRWVDGYKDQRFAAYPYGGRLERHQYFRRQVYRAATREDLFLSALSQPLSPFATATESVKQGILESYGLGTAVREFAIPEGEMTAESATRSALRLLNPLTTGYESTRLLAQAFREDSPTLDEAKYKASPYYRENIPWDAGMTEARAKALAEWNDAKQVRQYYAQKRPISAFLGNLTGQAFDPINYVPVGGPLVKAAAVARAGRVGGAVVTGAVDAATNTALAGLATREIRQRFGDDVSWQTTVSEIAMSALIGAAFGAVAGVLDRRAQTRAVADAERSLSTLRKVQEARIALNEGIDAIVRGEPGRLSPNATEPIARAASEIQALQIREAFTLRNPATHADVAESYRAVSDQYPELDRDFSPSRFDALIMADLRAKGFDGIAGDDARPATPIKFDPDGMDLPETKAEATDIERLRQAKAHLSDLERTLEVGGRIQNRFMRWLDAHTPGIPSVRYGSRSGFGEAAELSAAYYRRLPEYIEGAKAAIAELEGNAAKVSRRGGVPYNADIRADEAPLGRTEAEARIARADDIRALGEQYGIDSQTGAFAEMADIERLRVEGRLTAEDIAELEAADFDLQQAEAHGAALKSVVACLV